MLIEEEQELVVEFNEALKKVGGGKWKWEPKWGQEVLWRNAIEIKQAISDRYTVIGVLPPSQTASSGSYSKIAGVELLGEKGDKHNVPLAEIIPLFHWKEVVEMLEGMGCIVKVRDNESFGEDCKYNCGIYTDKLGVGASAPTRQEAVRRATIELAKQENQIAKTKGS